MTKFLIASVALLGVAGVASAQEVPAFFGQSPYATVDTQSAPLSVSGQASATIPGADLGTGFIVNLNQNYSGK